MLPKIKILYLSLCLIIFSNANAESYVKAGESLIWDSENKNYTANGDVEFSNDKFIAFADKMIAFYIEENDEEIFTIVELFENVLIEFKDKHDIIWRTVGVSTNIIDASVMALSDGMVWKLMNDGANHASI